MSIRQRPVLVGVDGSVGDELALQWAVDEANSRKVPLRLVYAHRWPPTDGASPVYFSTPGSDLTDTDADGLQLLSVAEEVIAAAVNRANALDPTVSVSGQAVDGHAVSVLLAESTRAALIVLGSRQLATFGSTMLGSVSAAVAGRAACPAIVVRGPSGLTKEGLDVVVGVDGSEAAEALLAFGFDFASRHRTPLRAVLCRHPDRPASMESRMQPSAPICAEAWVSETLAGWREKYPDVVVLGAVISEQPTAGLVAESLNQRLLVVGSRSRHALAGTLLGSVSQGVLHHAMCPVAVVPTHAA